ncbi:hypothetical protein ANN_21210 [Periplaneta americana]|uniref:Uncharacterized protein n=1 Tax=Periplaneta americana TaxID=6978 RepID=A0ABQ8SFX0_PERAM|nr:hypothetical protein ANN_21210 [Periplaneta americana]
MAGLCEGGNEPPGSLKARKPRGIKPNQVIRPGKNRDYAERNSRSAGKHLSRLNYTGGYHCLKREMSWIPAGDSSIRFLVPGSRIRERLSSPMFAVANSV